VASLLSIGALLARAPELAEHSVAPPALLPLPKMSELEAELNAMCRGRDAAPRAYAMLGNLLLRRGAYVDALEAYRSAADLDPADAPVHLACAEIAHVLDDAQTSAAYRARALAVQRVYPDPLPVGTRTPILLLLRDAPYAVNAPLEVLLDRTRVAVHKYYVEGEPGAPIPPHALAFTAFGTAEQAECAIARAGAFLATQAASINDPLRFAPIARERLAETLAGIEGVVVADARINAHADLAAAALPALIRPVDTHAGDGLAFVDDVVSLHAHLERHPALRYYVSDFVDSRGADGWFRKFRVIFVDGIAYPYHLAVAPHWMVHYQSSPMREYARLRAEELAFLERPGSVVKDWDRTMAAIGRAIGLDYVGIDATVLPDGRLFVFEADAAMLVHDEDARDVFAYKRPYVARIREALHEAIARRTRQRTP
jgi:tetratricopeptide (TPR) repeat protein